MTLWVDATVSVACVLCASLVHTEGFGLCTNKWGEGEWWLPCLGWVVDGMVVPVWPCGDADSGVMLLCSLLCFWSSWFVFGSAWFRWLWISVLGHFLSS